VWGLVFTCKARGKGKGTGEAYVCSSIYYIIKGVLKEATTFAERV